jgi:hypothetical protein
LVVSSFTLPQSTAAAPSAPSLANLLVWEASRRN